MSAVETETRNCGECEKFDRYGIDGKPAGKRELLIDGKSQQVPLGYCRGHRGLSLGKRTEISFCAHPEFKDKPISIAEIQPQSVLVESR